MKLLLLIGGIAFLLLGLILWLAALVSFFITRKRASRPAGAGSPPKPPVPPSHESAIPPSAVPASATLNPAEFPEPPPPPEPHDLPEPAEPEPRPASPTGTAPFPTFPVDSTIAVPMPESNPWGVLNGTSGSLAGRTFPLTSEGIYIGRDASIAQIVIEDGRVSKRHAWVGIKDGEMLVIDEGSTNGTYINSLGSRITRQVLNPGDTLIISNDVARLVYEQ